MQKHINLLLSWHKGDFSNLNKGNGRDWKWWQASGAGESSRRRCKQLCSVIPYLGVMLPDEEFMLAVGPSGPLGVLLIRILNYDVRQKLILSVFRYEEGTFCTSMNNKRYFPTTTEIGLDSNLVNKGRIISHWQWRTTSKFSFTEDSLPLWWPVAHQKDSFT